MKTIHLLRSTRINHGLRVRSKLISVLLITSMQLLLANAVNASQQNTWQPVASDSLIQLPAAIIEKRVAKDFQASPLALRLATLDQEMKASITEVRQLQEELKGDNVQSQQLRIELVQHKSQYLDLLQESHDLQQRSLDQKQALYKDVLEKLQKQTGKNQQSESFKIKQAQQAAQLRMQKVAEQMNSAMMHQAAQETSVYDQQYTNNVDQIEKLKQAIAKHKGNAMAERNGQLLSGEAYIRQLLMDSATEQSLLDQESLMLGFMAKLVALDAQTLEYEVAYEQNNQEADTKEHAKPSQVSSLFYQE